MSDEPRCHAFAPIRPGDEGPNYCDKPKGHDGEHSAPDWDARWPDLARIRWTDKPRGGV